MLYHFVSHDAADVIMLKRDAEKILRLLGKDLTPEGIITVAQLSGAIATLESAARSDRETTHQIEDPDEEGEDHSEPSVDFIQRMAPLLKVLRIARDGQKDVIWRT